MSKEHKTNTALTYKCEQHALNAEGEVVRRGEERPVVVTLVEHDKKVFFRGARVA